MHREVQPKTGANMGDQEESLDEGQLSEPKILQAVSLPPQYDEFLSQTYDPDYTADISTKMRVPDRIGPVNGMDPRYSLLEEERARITHRAASMNVPDRITVNEERFGPDSPYMSHLEGEVSRPSRPSMEQAIWPNLGAGESPRPGSDYPPPPSYNYGTPRGTGDDSLTLALAAIPTPGSALVDEDDDSDEVLLMRRQISKLARHVAHLEDENTKRTQRELILYPLVFGYVFFQIAKWFMQPR